MVGVWVLVIGVCVLGASVCVSICGWMIARYWRMNARGEWNGPGAASNAVCVFPVGSRERDEPAAACQRLSSLWRLRETAQHQAHSQAAQGTAAPAAPEQRRVHALQQSVSYSQQSQQPPEHLPSQAEPSLLE